MEKHLFNPFKSAFHNAFCLLTLFVLALTLFPTIPATAEQQPEVNPSYTVQKITEGVFAALFKPGGNTTSNAFFVVGESYVIAGSAHLTADAIRDLQNIVNQTTGLPIRYFILTHHHRGYTHIDFDFPADKEVIMTWQTWKGLSGEKREPDFPVIFFQEGLTMRLGAHTLIFSNLNRGHTEGDLLVYIPEAETIFTGDLFYNGSVGYLGEGYMQEWVFALEMMLGLDAKHVIPGQGPVATNKELGNYLTFLRAFLTEVLKHIEQGDSLKETLKTFSLPTYEEMDGFKQFQTINIQRAYEQLKAVAGSKASP